MLLVAIVTTLCSCVSLPPLATPKIALPEHWRYAPHDQGEIPGEPIPDLNMWWRTFNDPLLNRLIELVLTDNLTVAEASHRLKAARAQARQSDLRYKPMLNAKTISSPNVESTASYFQAGFDASWEFGLFGKYQSDQNLAAAEVGLAETAVDAARVSVVAEVVRSYIELRAAQARSQLDAQILELGRAAQAQTERRAQLGFVASTESIKIDQSFNADTIRSLGHRQAIDQSALALAQLLGRTDIDPAWLESVPQPLVPEGIVASTPAQLLRTRPEIKRAEWEISKAAAEVGVARAELYPQFALGGTLTYASKLDGDELLAPRSILSMGPLVSVPLLDWGMRRANLLAHSEQLSAAIIAYRHAVVDSVNEVESALASTAASRQRLVLQTKITAMNVELVKHTRRLRELGLTDVTDENAAERNGVEANFELVEARAAASVAVVGLYKALGGASILADETTPP